MPGYPSLGGDFSFFLFFLLFIFCDYYAGKVDLSRVVLGGVCLGGGKELLINRNTNTCIILNYRRTICKRSVSLFNY